MSNNFKQQSCSNCACYGTTSCSDSTENRQKPCEGYMPSSREVPFYSRCLGCKPSASQNCNECVHQVYAGLLSDPAIYELPEPDTDAHFANPDNEEKTDTGKAKWYLAPWKVFEGIVKVQTYGSEKYTENGWKEIDRPEDRYFAAMMRHWIQMQDGLYLDDESGLPHWAHFCCNAVFLGWFALKAHKK